MNDILDAAALRSAHVVRAVSRTAFGSRVRYRAAVVRAMAETFWELTEPKVEQRLRASASVVVTTTPAPESVQPHGALAAPPDGPVTPGDAERCTCRGSGEDWCGATKRDVVHDLMTTGARLSREQADFIWTTAQAKRAALA